MRREGEIRQKHILFSAYSFPLLDFVFTFYFNPKNSNYIALSIQDADETL